VNVPKAQGLDAGDDLLSKGRGLEWAIEERGRIEAAKEAALKKEMINFAKAATILCVSDFPNQEIR
jgi:hypothetical protein